jgi:hypothetical protein
MAGKTFEHTFGEDGTVTWRETDSRGTKKPPPNGQRKTDKASPETKTRYEVAPINEEVFAFSYLARSGYTLTSVLDFGAGTVVSFASNEKELVVQRGTFEVAQRVG